MLFFNKNIKTSTRPFPLCHFYSDLLAFPFPPNKIGQHCWLPDQGCAAACWSPGKVNVPR